MLGRFRTDVELVADRERPGTFRLRRRLGARALSIALVSAGFCAFAFDLYWERQVVAALQLPLSLALLWLHVRAELDEWTFEGDAAVRRSFAFGSLRTSELRLPAGDDVRVVVAREGKRACAWLETRAGERHALVAGAPEQVEAIAGAFERGFALAALKPPSALLH